MFRIQKQNKTETENVADKTRKLALAVSLLCSPQIFLIYAIVYVVLIQSKTLNYVFSKELVSFEI